MAKPCFYIGRGDLFLIGLAWLSWRILCDSFNLCQRQSKLAHVWIRLRLRGDFSFWRVGAGMVYAAVVVQAGPRSCNRSP